MKKTVAALLAVTTMLSTAVTAFAADVNVTDIIDAPIVEALENVPTVTEENINEEQPAEEKPAEEPTPEVTVPMGEASGFVFGADSDTGAVLGTTVLKPGSTYKFPVRLQFSNGDFAMTEDMISNYKFTYTRLSSASVSSFEIVASKGTYYLQVTVKSVSPLKPVDVKYNVKMVNKTDNMALFAQEVAFAYGFENANDDYIGSLDKGDVVEVDNTNPIITNDQFSTIAEANDYKNVTIAGPSWTLNVNVTDETTKNLYTTNAGIKEILAAYNDNEFKFWNFTGKPSFNATAKVALDVADVEEDFANLYAYRYANGKLYRINATYNTDDSTLEFRTNTLDTFLVTDKLIKDGSIVVENVAGDTTNEGNTTEDNTTGKPNPETGAYDMGGFLRQLFARLCGNNNNCR